MIKKGLKVVALAVLLLPALIMLTGISQEEDAPAWLIRSDVEDAIIQLSLWTSDGEFSAEEFYFDMVSFELGAPAYVYLFNISPESDGARQIHLLLPNGFTTDNYFEAGTYTLADEFEVPSPAGEAFIQAIATPLPLNIAASGEDEFRYLGNDPELFFDGLRVLIAAKGLISTEWTGEWVSYGVRAGGVVPLAGSRCGKVVIEAPALSGASVSYSIDANCINGRPINGQFVGPTSQEIAQVREGERTVTISASGVESTALTQQVTFGSTSTFRFAALTGTEFFGIAMDPVNPTAWQEITFTPDVTTSRPISNYIWDFGDGSAEAEGESVSHVYPEPTNQFPYRVKLTLVFSDGQEPQTQVVSKSLEVSVVPNAGACAPDTVAYNVFARSVLLESLELSGCHSAPIEQSIVLGGPISGKAKASVQYTWEAVPADAELQAFIVPTYVLDGVVLDAEPSVALLPATTGIFNKQIDLNIPAGAEVQFGLVLNILNNPSRGMVSLEVGPIELESTGTSCASARLMTRNATTGSEGDLLTFAQGTNVRIVFQNINCPDIDVARDSLVISQNGSEIINLQNQGIFVTRGGEAVWTWDQTDAGGIAVEQGLYIISIQTTQGSFVTRAILVR